MNNQLQNSANSYANSLKSRRSQLANREGVNSLVSGGNSQINNIVDQIPGQISDYSPAAFEAGGKILGAGITASSRKKTGEV